MEKRNRSRGFGLIEMLVTMGILAVVSSAVVALISNTFKGMSSAQKSQNRLEMTSAISTALRNKEVCGELLGAGSLSIPNGWMPGPSHAIPLTRLRVNSETLAEVGTAIHGFRATAITFENISGPYAVRYNIAAPPAAPDLRNFQRYFGKLTIQAEKVGGAENNVGGNKMRANEFRVTFLVDDANKVFDCFGGIEESDVAALCEKGFDGTYDPSVYPWCTPRTLTVGIKRSDLQTESPRFSVFEQAQSGIPTHDATMGLIGNPAGNGPGLWFAREAAASMPILFGNQAVIGYANRAGAYASNAVAGDLIISNRTPDRDLRMTLVQDNAGVKSELPLMTLKGDTGLVGNAGGVGIGTTNPQAVLDVQYGSAQDNPRIFSRTSQGALGIFGASDAGNTYSAIYLADNNYPQQRMNSWVLAHKGPMGGAPHYSFQINRWTGTTTMMSGIAILPNGNFGIHTQNPTERLHVNGSARVDGNQQVNGALQVNGNITATGTVTASSDRRLKKNIKPWENTLSKALQLTPVTFDWRDIKRSSPKAQIGFIAQDVEKIVPEAVETDKETGLKSVAYGNLVSLAIGAIRDLYKDFTGLNERQLATEAKLRTLEEKIDKLLKYQAELEAENAQLKAQD